MAKRLYVGNLSYDVTDDALRAVFAEAGEVASVSVLIDRMTNRSRGFGFVEMASDAAADEAIRLINGRELQGRALTVAEARPRTEGGDRGGPDSGSRPRRY